MVGEWAKFRHYTFLGDCALSMAFSNISVLLAALFKLNVMVLP
jgi:hypothetical protein